MKSWPGCTGWGEEPAEKKRAAFRRRSRIKKEGELEGGLNQSGATRAPRRPVGAGPRSRCSWDPLAPGTWSPRARAPSSDYDSDLRWQSFRLETRLKIHIIKKALAKWLEMMAAAIGRVGVAHGRWRWGELRIKTHKRWLKEKKKSEMTGVKLSLDEAKK